MSRKPFRSRFNRAFLAVVAALGIGSSGLMLEQLPKNPATDTQKVSTFETSTGLRGYNISPSDQLWKHALGMKSDAQKADDLVAAAWKGDSWRAQALFEHGMQAKSAAAAQALAIASLQGDNDVVNVLLQNGVDPTANDGLAMVAAVKGNHMGLALRYLDLGVPGGSRESQALAIAAMDGNNIMVQELIDHGAKVADRGQVSLSLAAASGHEDVVATLLANGADARAKNSEALIWAAEAGQAGVIRQLIAAGADVTTSDNAPLIFAAGTGSNEAVKAILEKRGAGAADIHAQGDEALQIAIVAGFPDVAQTLIDNGANVNAGNGMALSLAIVQDDYLMASLLLRNGADVNAGDGMALATAVSLNHHGMATYLMGNGANPGLRNGAIKAGAGDTFMKGILQGETTGGNNSTPDPGPSLF